jgi:nucleoside-diphosphate-sugar epimerase
MSAHSDISPFGPTVINTAEEIEDIMTRPTPEVMNTIAGLKGDIMILGVGGKMGPTLAKLAKRSIDEAGLKKKVIGVDRFPTPEMREQLERSGVETVTCDLLDRVEVDKLPHVANIIFMAGMKFGTTGNNPLTWAINVYLPALVAQRFRSSRIVAFSTGNVYPFSAVSSDGAAEDVTPEPLGDYAQSCLGRERMFQYFSQQYGTLSVLIRLAYAIDLRYGVLLDIGQKVFSRAPIDLGMGYVNVIWQGDANAQIIRSLALCESPPKIINVTSPETYPVRWIAEKFGEQFGVQPILEGKESASALLVNAAMAKKLFGPPRVSIEQMVRWISHWVERGGQTLNKPTHFEVRDGKY